MRLTMSICLLSTLVPGSIPHLLGSLDSLISVLVMSFCLFGLFLIKVVARGEGSNWIQAHRQQVLILNVDFFVGLKTNQLGVPSFVAPFEMCNDTVGGWFVAREMVSVASMYAKLMDHHKLPLMFFNGNLDFTISTIGVENWLYKLNWSGQGNYQIANRTIWRYDPSDPFAVAGYVKQSGLLTFVSVANAGHSVCQDQQLRSREVIARFCVCVCFFFL
jgi:carboxypeptidase C (cathepsin A)